MSALPPITDMLIVANNVRYVPTADSFNEIRSCAGRLVATKLYGDSLLNVVPWRPGLGEGAKDLRGKRPRDTEPGVVDPVIGGPLDAEGRAEALRTAVPGTAAKDTGITVTICHPCRAIVRSAAVTAMGAILNPFPNIAVHVM